MNFISKMLCFCNSTNFQELLETELMYVTDLEQAATYITYMRNSKEAEEADIRYLTSFGHTMVSHHRITPSYHTIVSGCLTTWERGRTEWYLETLRASLSGTESKPIPRKPSNMYHGREYSQSHWTTYKRVSMWTERGSLFWSETFKSFTTVSILHLFLYYTETLGYIHTCFG